MSNVGDNSNKDRHCANVFANGAIRRSHRVMLLQSKLPMAQIRPFRAFRYDASRVSLSAVVTQPYDKITSAMQERYYAASPYNLTRIILGKRESGDDAKSNVYSRAADHFRAWRQEGILRQDSEPSLYVYSQTFAAPGGSTAGFHRGDQATQVERRGLIALGRIEDYSAGVVFRHEQTLSKPKADRLDLLRSTRGHFGQIFMLYEDSGQVEALLATEQNPALEATDEYGVQHRLWRISDVQTIASVQKAFADKKLVIADGHHRYETALNYRNEQRASGGMADNGSDSSEFVMMTLVNMDSPALLILPTHRVVHSLKSFSDEDFRRSARKFFDVDVIDSAIEPAAAVTMLREAGRAVTSILAVTADRAFLLHHPDLTAMAPFLAGLSLRQQALDIVQLHKCLLENVLKLSEESILNQQNISYVRDAGEAISQVRQGGANIAFLMNPCRVSQVRDIALAGEVMPQKSTDFYPKLLSGLTIYALE